MNLSEALKLVIPDMKKVDNATPIGGWQNNDYIAIAPGNNGTRLLNSSSYIVDKKAGKYLGKCHDVFGKITTPDGEELTYDFSTTKPISEDDIKKAIKFTI